MMLGGKHTCVEEDQGDDQPEHELGLADVADSASVLPVPPRIILSSSDSFLRNSYFSNCFIFFCMNVSGAPERS